RPRFADCDGHRRRTGTRGRLPGDTPRPLRRRHDEVRKAISATNLGVGWRPASVRQCVRERRGRSVPRRTRHADLSGRHGRSAPGDFRWVTEPMATGWIRARAPATIANLGPGFDVFALAIRGLADEVAVRPAEHDSLRVQGVDAADIPSTFSGNTAGIVIEALRAATGITQSLEVRVTKGIPSGRGLGSSAASCAAAALVFLRAFPKSRDLGIAGVVRAAVEGEAAVSGRHYDNLAAALLGGFVTLGSSEPVLLSRIPVNPRIALAIAIPRFALCGSGSSVFAFAPDRTVAGDLAEAMCDGFRSAGQAASPFVTSVDNRVPIAGLLPALGRRFYVLTGRGPAMSQLGRPAPIPPIEA